MPSLLRECLPQLALGLLLIGGPAVGQAQEQDKESQAPPTARQQRERAAVKKLLTVPAENLPEGVQLKGLPKSGSIISVTSNPGILAEPKQIRPIAMFFGLREPDPLQPVRFGVAAMYQEQDAAEEIGIYGLYFASEQDAQQQFEKLTRGRTDSPFLRKGRLLLYTWKEESVSNAALQSVTSYLKTTKLDLDEAQQPGAPSPGR